MIPKSEQQGPCSTGQNNFHAASKLELGFVNHMGNALARREMKRPFVSTVSAKARLSSFRFVERHRVAVVGTWPRRPSSVRMNT